MKNYLMLLYTLCMANFAFAQLTSFPKDSVKTGNQYTAFYTANQSAKTNQLIVAIQGCYSDGNTFANETVPFAQQVNATLISIENKQKTFLNTAALKPLLKKLKSKIRRSMKTSIFLDFPATGLRALLMAWNMTFVSKALLLLCQLWTGCLLAIMNLRKTFRQ